MNRQVSKVDELASRINDQLMYKYPISLPDTISVTVEYKDLYKDFKQIPLALLTACVQVCDERQSGYEIVTISRSSIIPWNVFIESDEYINVILEEEGI